MRCNATTPSRTVSSHAFLADPLIATAMSAARSSSAVRDLKAIFENRAATTLGSETPGSRGRSPSGLGSDKENGYRTTSKIRASFVPVEPASMATTVEDTSMSARRGSFGEGDGDLLDLKKTVSEQQETMEVPESVLQSAVVTPLKKHGEGQLGHDDSPLASKVEKAPSNPDKPVTGAEEEPGSIKPCRRECCERWRSASTRHGRSKSGCKASCIYKQNGHEKSHDQWQASCHIYKGQANS